MRAWNRDKNRRLFSSWRCDGVERRIGGLGAGDSTTEVLRGCYDFRLSFGFCLQVSEFRASTGIQTTTRLFLSGSYHTRLSLSGFRRYLSFLPSDCYSTFRSAAARDESIGGRIIESPGLGGSRFLAYFLFFFPLAWVDCL